MTLRKLASLIALREGKKVQARIGEIREVLNVICTLQAEHDIATPGLFNGPIDALTEQADKITERLSKRKRKG